jgi:hypothetical protein
MLVTIRHYGRDTCRGEDGHESNKARQRKQSKDLPLFESEDISPQRVALSSKKPKYATRTNHGEIAEYLFAVCKGKSSRFAKAARRQLSELIVSRQMELGTITEAPSLASLNGDIEHDQKILNLIFRSIGLKVDVVGLSITDLRNLISRLSDEVFQISSKRGKSRR